MTIFLGLGILSSLSSGLPPGKSLNQDLDNWVERFTTDQLSCLSTPPVWPTINRI